MSLVFSSEHYGIDHVPSVLDSTGYVLTPSMLQLVDKTRHRSWIASGAIADTVALGLEKAALDGGVDGVNDYLDDLSPLIQDSLSLH